MLISVVESQRANKDLEKAPSQVVLKYEISGLSFLPLKLEVARDISHFGYGGRASCERRADHSP